MEGPRILIVGEKGTPLDDLVGGLWVAGYRVLGVVSLAEATRQPCGEIAPDLILMDVPTGTSLENLQVAEKLRSDFDAPFLYLADAADALLLQRAGILAPSGYLLKPVQVSELCAAIERILYHRSVEMRLAEREASYRGLFEDAPFLVWEEDFSAVKAYLDSLRESGVTDLETYLRSHPEVVQHCASLVKILNVNQTSVELFAAPDKDTLLQGLPALFVDQSMAVFTEEILAFSRWQKRFESEIVGRKLNGELMDTWFQATLVSGYEETWGKVFITATDITARKRAEEALRQERRLLRAVVDHLPDAIYVKDRQGRKTLANRADQINMSVASEEEVLGKTDRDIFPPEMAVRFEAVDRQVFDTGQPQLNHEEYLCNCEGRCVWLLTSKLPLKDSSGQVVGLVGIGRDITERKRMELERELTIALLRLINEKEDLRDLVCAVLDLLQRDLDCEAIGMRLRRDGDFPYFETRGFSPEFVQTDNSLWRLVAPGVPSRDGAGNSSLECGCGLVLEGHVDPTQPYFTAHGSFWTGTASRLLATAFGADQGACLRTYCYDAGYESIVLVPLRLGGEVLGLLQLHDRRPEHFDRQTVALLERLADSLATAIAHRRVETALKRSEATLRSIFSAASIGIGLVVGDRVIAQVNDRICEMTGYTPEELIGKNARILYPTDEDYEYVGREKYRQIDAYGTGSVETRWQRKDGRVLDIWLSSTPLDSANRAAGVIFTALDITERKRVEQERERLLRQVQEQTLQMQQIMETVPEGVVLLDAELRVLLCNPAAHTHLPVLTSVTACKPGQKLEQLGGRPMAELLSPPPRGLWHEMSVGRRHFQLIARPIETGPMVGGWVLLTRDVTEEYAFRETVQRQERLATVGQLAAGIAHDFNNILAGIVLYSQISLRLPGLPAQLREHLKIIAGQAHRAADLINQILDFSRSQVLERLPLDLVPLLKEQVKLWERTLPENIEVSFDYEAGIYTVSADPTRMQQVFMNLVVNARDAMPDGGKLHIALRRLHFDKPKQAPLPDMSPGDWIEVAVADTGAGIPDEILPYIYDPFFTTKPPGKGTGLGLTQVYGIVSSHDGFIDVKTQVGVGTTFLIYLPALPMPEASQAAAMDDLPLGHGETILVVEDNAAARAAIVATLELLDYRVLQAENGKVALQVFAEHRQEIALVLSDLVMAEMGGKALAQVLHQQDPTVRVVVMTGHPLTEDREALRDIGVLAWIQKPPELEHLARVLANACSGMPSDN